MTDLVIRPLAEFDSLEVLTQLLHRAYRPLLEMGLRFVAATQTVDTTRERVSAGTCFVAERSGALVGTVTLYRGGDEGYGYYAREDLAYFGQLAVDPDEQGIGLGRRLVSHVEALAQTWGCVEIALDTSKQATHLIRLYEKWGYRTVSEIKWEEVNYESVIMAKALWDTIDGQDTPAGGANNG